MSKKDNDGVVVIPLSKSSPHFDVVCPLIEALVGTIETMSLLPSDIIDIISSLICYTVSKINLYRGDHPEVSREDFAQEVLSRVKAIDISLKDPKVLADIEEACLRHKSKMKSAPSPEPEPEMPFYA
jgi:hypothetical protein